MRSRHDLHRVEVTRTNLTLGELDNAGHLAGTGYAFTAQPLPHSLSAYPDSLSHRFGVQGIGLHVGFELHGSAVCTKTVRGQAPNWSVHPPLVGASHCAMKHAPQDGSAVTAAFARRLAVVREAYGQNTGQAPMDQKDFAKALGVEPERYRKYERGEREPPLWLLHRIATMTGFSLDFLISGKPLNRAA